MSSPELRIKRLARIPSNCQCPNCGVEKKFGFSSVCVKSLAFICNECKASHGAISHRCKSLTMSAWTSEEVDQLEAAGNTVCMETWLKHAPPFGVVGRPRPGDDIGVYKRFVVTAYEDRKYFGERDEANPSVAVQPTVAAPPPQQRTKQSSIPARAPAVLQTAPQPAMDLLDFASPAPAPSFAATSALPMDAFSADFGSFQVSAAATAPSTTQSPAAGNSNSADVFGGGGGSVFDSTPPPAAPTATITTGYSDPFGSFQQSRSAPSSNNNAMSDFASFASMNDNSSTITATQPVVVAADVQPKKPIMGGSASSNNAMAISMLDSSVGAGGNRAGGGMAMNNNINNSFMGFNAGTSGQNQPLQSQKHTMNYRMSNLGMNNNGMMMNMNTMPGMNQMQPQNMNYGMNSMGSNVMMGNMSMNNTTGMMGNNSMGMSMAMPMMHNGMSSMSMNNGMGMGMMNNNINNNSNEMMSYYGVPMNMQQQPRR